MYPRPYLLAAVLTAFVVWAAWPGFLDVDALVQLREAHSNHFGGWQPALGSFLWRAFPLPSGLLIAQTALFFFSLARLAVVARRTLLRFFLLALLPLPFLGPLWKDSQMAVCLLASFAFFPRSFWFLALAFRADAIVALAPFFRRRWRVIVFLLALVLLLANALAAKTHFVSQQIFVQDLAAVSVAEQRNAFPDFFLQNGLSPLNARYNENSIVPVLFDARDFHLAETPREYAALIGAWLHEAPLHPWLLCKAHWHRFARIMGVNGVPEGVVFVSHPGPLHAAWFWQFLRDHAWLFRGWPYALILLMRRRSPIAESGLWYLAALFFIAPAVEFRYLAWPMMAACASLL